ncbi:hypothetical protein STEG23_020456, partial [Scotinomys teguina]
STEPANMFVGSGVHAMQWKSNSLAVESLGKVYLAQYLVIAIVQRMDYQTEGLKGDENGYDEAIFGIV